MATPALRALRAHFHDYHIACLGRPAALDVLRPAGWVDQWIIDASGPNRLSGFLDSIWRLRRGNFDLAVLFPNSFRAALLGRLGGVRRLAGYDRDGRGWMLAERLPVPRDERGALEPVAAIDYYFGLVRVLGAECVSRRMWLEVGESSRRQARSMLTNAGASPEKPLVMLNPGASFGVSKMWDSAGYAAVADALIEQRDAQIIINAAPAERPVAAQVAQAMRNEPLISFAGRDNTIGLLKGLMLHCDLLITNDTGARHIAAAMGVAVVSVFGSTDPRWTEIYCDRERIVRVDVPCWPCRQRVCPQPAGPAYHQCMAAITPQMVLAAAGDLLDTPAPVLEGGL